MIQFITRTTTRNNRMISFIPRSKSTVTKVYCFVLVHFKLDYTWSHLGRDFIEFGKYLVSCHRVTIKQLNITRKIKNGM